MTHNGQAKRAILIAPLASQVAAGFSLMLLQSVAGKAITAVGQVMAETVRRRANRRLFITSPFA